MKRLLSYFFDSLLLIMVAVSVGIVANDVVGFGHGIML